MTTLRKARHFATQLSGPGAAAVGHGAVVAVGQRHTRLFG